MWIGCDSRTIAGTKDNFRCRLSMTLQGPSEYDIQTRVLISCGTDACAAVFSNFDCLLVRRHWADHANRAA